MAEIKADLKDLGKEDPAKLLQEREDLLKKINDRNTSFTDKLDLSGKLLKLDNKISKANIGVMK